METLRLCNFCNIGATLLGFGTLFTNIILLWIRNFEKNPTTRTPKKNQKNPKKRHGFLRWDILPMLWVRRLGFGTVFTNIILLWIQNFEKNRITPTPKKNQKTPKKTYGFSQWNILPTLWVRRLGFGTVFTNIILLWIRNFEKNLTTPTPPKKQKKNQKRLIDFHDGTSCQHFEL